MNKNNTQKNMNKKEYKFRIRKTTYYDEIGCAYRTSYYVQQRKSILKIKYWKTHTHETLGLNGLVTVPTRFDTYGEAYAFCKRIERGNRIDSTKDEIISYV